MELSTSDPRAGTSTREGTVLPPLVNSSGQLTNRSRSSRRSSQGDDVGADTGEEGGSGSLPRLQGDKAQHNEVSEVSSHRNGELKTTTKMRVFEENLEKFIHGIQGQKSKADPDAKTRTSKKLIDKESLAKSIQASPYLQALIALPKNSLPKEGEGSGTEGKQRNAYRKRYQEMIRKMEDEGKKAREDSELKLKKQMEMAAKLKSKLGLDNVAPKFMLPRSQSWIPGLEGGDENKEINMGERKEEEEDKDLDENQLAAKKEAAARNKALLERTKQTLQKLVEKQKTEKEEQEERQRKEELLKRRLREKAMENVERAKDAQECTEGNQGNGESRQRRQGGDENEEVASPKRADIERQIAARTRRYQDRFSSEEEEEQWLRKKYGCSETDKLFCIAGGGHNYQGIRNALLARGWKEHREEESMIFDLKWTVKTSDIPFKALNKEQVVNHFARNGNLTTKVGLTRNLRNLKWFEDVDMDDFFPRSYNLQDFEELLDFVEDFKMVCAENLLKKFLKDGVSMVDPEGHPYGEHSLYCVQLTCLAVDSFIRRCNVLDIDDVSSQLELTAAEWTMILGEPCPVLDRRSSSSSSSSSETTSALSKRQRTVGYRPFGGKLEFGQGTKLTLEEIVMESKAARKLKQREAEELQKESESLLQQLQQMNVQSSLNGLDNVWIVKPAGKSRGRDIICANRINRILEYIGFGISGKEMHWVVQKYLERPFLINKRKFDIRQWIMVTDWNPLTVWFYDECYLRFSMSDFSMKDLEDNYTHLCNNSIQKEGDNFEQIKNSSMWDLQSFKSFLSSHDQQAAWEDKILPQMKRISKWALMCAQDMLENRKFSCEVYGYDFILDQDLNVWLLEVNASPDMSASTQVTERLTERVMEDMVKVIVDAKDFNWGRRRLEKEPACETGGWGLVHRGDQEVSFPISAFGCKLALVGTEIPIHTVFVGKPPEYTLAGSSRDTRARKLREQQLELQLEAKKEPPKPKMRKKKSSTGSSRTPAVDPQGSTARGQEHRGEEEEKFGALGGWGDEDFSSSAPAGYLARFSRGLSLQEQEVETSPTAEEEEEEEEERAEVRKPRPGWALKAAEKLRRTEKIAEKLKPANASKRSTVPNKEVLPTRVVTLGADLFGF